VSRKKAGLRIAALFFYVKVVKVAVVKVAVKVA